jgi:hypothetical protein
VKPPYLEPGPGVSYYLAGSGFVAGEQVQILRGNAVMKTVSADAQGTIQVKLALPKGTPVGTMKYTAKGVTSARTSNQGVLVVLAPRNTAGFPYRVFVSTVIR